MQNYGYTRAQTYITETDLEKYTSRPSTLVHFIGGCQLHPIKLQTNYMSNLYPLQRYSEYLNAA